MPKNYKKKLKNSDLFDFPKLVSTCLGFSQLGRKIELLKIGSGPCTVLLLAGVHGDEPEGILFLERFVSTILLKGSAEQEQTGDAHSPLHFPNLTIHIIPLANPDGVAQKRRTNHHNVDLNRNFPTTDWTCEFTNPRYYPGSQAASEPETKVQMDYLRAQKPHWLITFHSYEKALMNFNGRCRELAQRMAKANLLPIVDSMGYPTPGSLGTYAGVELDIPTITYEFLRGEPVENNWQGHWKAVWSGLEILNKGIQK